MDDPALVGALAAVAILAVVGVVGAVAYAYATDYTLKADVQDKECDPSLSVVSIRTRAFGIDHDVKGVPHQECGVIEVGDEVRYQVRSKHTAIYRDGECFYDSETGPGCGKGPLGLL